VVFSSRLLGSGKGVGSLCRRLVHARRICEQSRGKDSRLLFRLEHEIKELDKQIRELRRTAALAQSLQDKLTHQKQLRDLERRRNSKRRELFDAQDAIDQQREDLIGKIEKQLKHRSEIHPLFTIRWAVR